MYSKLNPARNSIRNVQFALALLPFIIVFFTCLEIAPVASQEPQGELKSAVSKLETAISAPSYLDTSSVAPLQLDITVAPAELEKTDNAPSQLETIAPSADSAAAAPSNQVCFGS